MDALHGAELAEKFIEFSLVCLVLLLACGIVEIRRGNLLVECADECVVAAARTYALFQTQTEVCASCGKIVLAKAETTLLE